MFFDGKDNSLSDRPTEYDVVIVGGGPAGITLALELQEGTSLRIALLESGGKEYDEDAQDLNVGTLLGNDDAYYLDSSRLRYLGGTSNHWGGHCTPMDPIDFERSPAAGFTGWPISKAQLDPFYERAHVYCDLGRYEYALDALAPMDPELRLLPDNPELETVVIRQSAPTRFGDKYHADLSESWQIDVWLNTTATNVETGPELAETQTVVTTTLDGFSRDFTARSVIMAGGAIEATRLLQWANAKNDTKAGDEVGLLGKCFMDHPSGGAAFLHFERPIAPKLYWENIDTYADGGVPLHFLWRMTDQALEDRGLPNFQYLVFPFAQSSERQARQRAANGSYFGLRDMAKRVLGREVHSEGGFSGDYCRFVGGLDEFAAERGSQMIWGNGFSKVLLKYEAEQRPSLANTVELDPTDRDATGMPRPILTWDPTRDDVDALKETAMLFGQFAGADGLGRIQLEEYGDDPYWGMATAWHQLGTMRMAETARSGVVDPNCKVYGAGELYVASGAVFPSVGRANPTLTIVALTIRLADHLKKRMSA